MILSALISLACFLVPLVAIASSSNTPILANVRVEWTNSTIFDGYVLTSGHDVEPASGGKHFCDGTNGKYPTRVPVATAALDDVSVIANFTWEGIWTESSEFKFKDYFVTRIANFPEEVNSSVASWFIYLNYEWAPVGGCQLQIKQLDEVLLAFYPIQPNFQAEAALYLSGPQEVLVNSSYMFRVTNGTNGLPIAGASVGGKTTDNHGYVSLEFPETGVRRLKAEKPSAVRSNSLRVVVTPPTVLVNNLSLKDGENQIPFQHLIN